MAEIKKPKSDIKEFKPERVPTPEPPEQTTITAPIDTNEFRLGGTEVNSTADELNKLEGTEDTVTPENLNTLTDGSDASSLHTHIPSYFAVPFNEFADGHKFNRNVTVYTDDLDYLILDDSGAHTKIVVWDATSGGDIEERAITSDWAAADETFGVVKIGSFLYAGLVDTGAPHENRVYRYNTQDLAAGGTRMTISGTPFGTTADVVRMISDGTDLWLNQEAGDTTLNNHVFRKYTISGTTLTSGTTVTCGSSNQNFIQGAALDAAGNFYGYDNTDEEVQRYDSSGTLQATTSLPTSTVNSSLYTIKGVPFFTSMDSVNLLFHFRKLALQA